MPTFARAKGLGKWGEKHVIAHLRKNPVIDFVEDVSEDETWQKQGVDILYGIADGQGSQFTADIKMDRMIARTGNLFIETMSSEKVMGNMVTSSADFFLYLDPYGCKLYTINRQTMFEYWQRHQRELEIKKVGNKDRLTQGFVISTEDVVAKGLASVEDIYIEGARNNTLEAPVEALPF